MSRLLRVALVLALAPAAVRAQGTDFYPLAEGDSWIFERSEDDVRLGGPYTALLGYRRVEARGDTLIAGDAYRLVDVTHLDVALQTTGTARCAVRAEPGTHTPIWIALQGDCAAAETGQPFDESTEPTDYSVGGVVYNGTLRLRYSTSAYSEALAQHVGVIRAKVLSGNFWLHWQRLQAATVGGVAYGVAPDPTAWREFAPLAVGTRHVYRWESSPNSSGYAATSVVGTVREDGRDYARVVRQSYSSAGVLLNTLTHLYRHDDARGCVAVREDNGSEGCTTSGDLRLRSHVGLQTVSIGGETVERLTFEDVRRTGFSDGRVRHASGIGLVSSHSGSAGGPGGGSSSSTTLVYAEVDGVSYGTLPPWVVFPVADEPAPASAALAVRLAGPNPTGGVVRLRVASPAAGDARVDVVDVLGRTVASRRLALVAGETTVQVDLGPHAAGVYRVRVATPDGSTATLAVTRS